MAEYPMPGQNEFSALEEQQMRMGQRAQNMAQQASQGGSGGWAKPTAVAAPSAALPSIGGAIPNIRGVMGAQPTSLAPPSPGPSAPPPAGAPANGTPVVIPQSSDTAIY